eukprot:gene26264-17366_t
MDALGYDLEFGRLLTIALAGRPGASAPGNVDVGEGAFRTYPVSVDMLIPLDSTHNMEGAPPQMLPMNITLVRNLNYDGKKKEWGPRAADAVPI